MKNKNYIFSLIFLLNTFIIAAPADDFNFTASKNDSLITVIENAIKDVNMDLLLSFLDQETFLSLNTNINGYFSRDQIYYILEDFLTSNKPLSIKFNSINSKKESIFAAGILRVKSDRIVRTLKIFLSLKRSSNGWKISQLTIS